MKVKFIGQHEVTNKLLVYVYRSSAQQPTSVLCTQFQQSWIGNLQWLGKFKLKNTHEC